MSKIKKSCKKGSVRNRKSVKKSKPRRKSCKKGLVRNRKSVKKSKPCRKSCKKGSVRNRKTGRCKSKFKPRRKSSKKYDYGFEKISDTPIDTIFSFLRPLEQYNLSQTYPILSRQFINYFRHGGEIILSIKNSHKYIEDPIFINKINTLSNGKSNISLNLSGSSIIDNENISNLLILLVFKNNIKKLNLSYNALETIPEKIGNLTNLEYLFLYNNKLSSVPDTM